MKICKGHGFNGYREQMGKLQKKVKAQPQYAIKRPKATRFSQRSH